MNDAINRLNAAIEAFFDKNKDIATATAKDITVFLKKKDGETYLDDRKGLPVRKLLRKLDKKGKLSMIPCCYFEQKEHNKNWFFRRLGKIFPEMR